MSITRLVLLFLFCAAARVFAAEPRTILITHPHDEVIHGWHADDLAGRKLDRSGASDVSRPLNQAMEKLFNQGGGTLYLPAGKYRLDKPVFIPPGTALRGDFVQPGPHKVDPDKNTVICAYYGRDMDERSDPLFFQDGSSLIDGLVVWYPEQKADAVVPYAPTIRQDQKDSKWAINSAARNIFLVNAYTGIQLGKEGRGTCIELMKNIFGTPLRSGIEVWRDADIPRMVGVDFNPDYWPAAGLDREPPDLSVVKKYLIENASGITYHRCDGSELANITIRGYHKGLELGNGHIQDNGTWLDNEGHYINFKITECYYAVWIQNIKNHGTQFYNCVLEGLHSAVFVENPMHGMECAMFMGCELRGGKAALTQTWEGRPNDRFSLMFSACEFKSPIEWTGGNLIVTDCEFTFEGRHLTIGPDTKTTIITDSRFKGLRQIDNRAGDKLKISEPRNPYIKVPEYTYDVDKISSYKPTTTATVVVKAGDGKKDDSKRIQKAVDAVSRKGGGYVVLSPGFYSLNDELIIRSNVELRGTMQSWQHSKFLSFYAERGEPKGAVVFVKHGRNAEKNAVITLERNAGLDGLFFHHPDQEYSIKTKEVLNKFGWLIRMKGDRSYVKHVTASNPWRFIDVYTHDPKDTYIGYCAGAPLDMGICVGEAENCMIDNVHFNSWYWNTVYFPNKPSRIGKNAYKEELDNWMKANTKAFVFAGSKNLNVYGTFIFCSREAFKLLPGKQSGKGPSGIIINSGCDWSKYGLYMHANDGLVFANMHFIDLAAFDDDMEVSSIYVAPKCDDSVTLYNVSTWGDSPRTLYMQGNARSQVNICNFSYQLYPDQENRIDAGKAIIVNAIRNVPKKSIGFDMGASSYLVLRGSIFPEELSVTPSSVKTNLEDTADDFLDTSSGRGVRRSHSFP